MNPQLGREVTRAIAKARITTPALARRTGLGESWIKQVRSGRIAKPKPEWLTKIAEELGADPAEWLALSNQLGAAADHRATAPDQVAEAIRANTEVLSRLVDETRAGRTAQEALMATMAEILGRLVPAGTPRPTLVPDELGSRR